MLMIQTAAHPRLLAKLTMNSVLSGVLLSGVLFTGILLTAIFLPAPAIANENVLEVVPENALGFVVVNRLADVSEKLGKHTQDLELPLPDLLMMLKMIQMRMVIVALMNISNLQTPPSLILMETE